MGVVVAATGEQEPQGWYPMERLAIAGSRFARVAMVADLLRKGTDESTFGPWFAMTGSSVAGSGAGGASLRISGAQHADIAQNSFAASDGVLVIHSVGAPETRIASNVFAATPAPRIEELAWKGAPRGHMASNIVEPRP
jgi:poly(beta-D-mannuronate) lyase